MNAMVRATGMLYAVYQNKRTKVKEVERATESLSVKVRKRMVGRGSRDISSVMLCDILNAGVGSRSASARSPGSILSTRPALHCTRCSRRQRPRGVARGAAWTAGRSHRLTRRTVLPAQVGMRERGSRGQSRRHWLLFRARGWEGKHHQLNR